MDQSALIDADELQAFAEVATQSSFSLAAAALGVAQSTISQRLARLERRAGRQLIRRTTRSVELTPDGESMLIYARSILAVAEDARRRLHSPPIAGLLRVGIEDEFTTTRLPRVLGIFRSQYPDFGLRFVTGRNEHLRTALQNRDVDVILGKAHPGQKSGEVLWEEKLVWYGDPGVIVDPDAAIPLLSYLRPSVTRDIVETALQEAHRTWITVAEASNLLGLLAGVEARMGVMALGRTFGVPGLVEMPGLAGLPELGALACVLEQRPGPVDPAAQAFVDVLRQFAVQLSRDRPPAIRDDAAD